MAHILPNRKRILDLTSDQKELRRQFRWETINAISYKIGGLLFVIGSYFFFPSQTQNQIIGSWLFLSASMIYLLVNLHDLSVIRVHYANQKNHDIKLKLEYLSVWIYFVGTCCFLFGRVVSFDFIGMPIYGTYLFIFGSLLFFIGAAINIALVTKEESLKQLQLSNLTSITFMLGSVLFFVASIPAIWNFEYVNDKVVVQGFLASQFMLGSIFFLLGGVFNYYRLYDIVQEAITLTKKQ